MTPRFSVGDNVTCHLPSIRLLLDCQVVRVMPEEKDMRHYRVRHASESFDRSVPEDSLVLRTSPAQEVLGF